MERVGLLATMWGVDGLEIGMRVVLGFSLRVDTPIAMLGIRVFGLNFVLLRDHIVVALCYWLLY